MKKVIYILIIITVANLLIAQPNIETKSISVFKNGKSFVVREGVVETKNNEYLLDKIPNALMGTFWFSGKNSYVTQVTSSFLQVDEPIERKATSFFDLLYANKGKQITILTNERETYNGIVEELDLPEQIANYLRLKEKELSENYPAIDISDFKIFGGQIFSLKMNNKWISLSPTNIKAIEFNEKPNHMVKSNLKTKKPILKIQFNKSGPQGLNMIYLQDGISWNPTYLLMLLSETEASLKLQAEVINDVEHIKNCDINFVIGVPNFKYATQPATLTTLTQTIKDYYSMATYNKSNIYSNALIPSQIYAEESIADYDDVSTVYNEDNKIEQNEDFYFYTVKNVDLEKGARAHYPLFESKIKIKHLYECNLSNSQINSSYYHEENFSFDTKYSNVYHSIEIKNDTKNPFTTGPIMIVSELKAISQDLLKYTATGLTSSIKLTQSSDIRIEEKEKISNIGKNYTKFNNDNYRLVTLQSEIIIVNSKNQDINFSLNKHIMGTLKNVSEKYTNHSKVLNNNINQTENFNIRIVLKAKETKKINYTYQVYVR